MVKMILNTFIIQNQIYLYVILFLCGYGNIGMVYIFKNVFFSVTPLIPSPVPMNWLHCCGSPVPLLRHVVPVRWTSSWAAPHWPRPLWRRAGQRSARWPRRTRCPKTLTWCPRTRSRQLLFRRRKQMVLPPSQPHKELDVPGPLPDALPPIQDQRDPDRLVIPNPVQALPAAVFRCSPPPAIRVSLIFSCKW